MPLICLWWWKAKHNAALNKIGGLPKHTKTYPLDNINVEVLRSPLHSVSCKAHSSPFYVLLNKKPEQCSSLVDRRQTNWAAIWIVAFNLGHVNGLCWRCILRKWWGIEHDVKKPANYTTSLLKHLLFVKATVGLLTNRQSLLVSSVPPTIKKFDTVVLYYQLVVQSLHWTCNRFLLCFLNHTAVLCIGGVRRGWEVHDWKHQSIWNLAVRS